MTATSGHTQERSRRPAISRIDDGTLFGWRPARDECGAQPRPKLFSVSQTTDAGLIYSRAQSGSTFKRQGNVVGKT